MSKDDPHNNRHRQDKVRFECFLNVDENKVLLKAQKKLKTTTKKELLLEMSELVIKRFK